MKFHLSLFEKKLARMRHRMDEEEVRRQQAELMLLFCFYKQQNFYSTLRMRDFLSYEEM